MSTDNPSHSFDVTDELNRLQAVPPAKIKDVTQDMILEIAGGREEPKVIAARYGFEGMDWVHLEESKWFNNAVDAQRAELERDGGVLRAKAIVVTGLLLDDLARSLLSTQATIPQKLDGFKTFAKTAGVDAPVQQAQASGPGFYININLGDDKPAKRNLVVDV